MIWRGRRYLLTFELLRIQPFLSVPSRPLRLKIILNHCSTRLAPVLSNRDYDRFAEDLRSGALESMAVEFALEDPAFSLWQRRRGGTEARIAILRKSGGGFWRCQGGGRTLDFRPTSC